MRLMSLLAALALKQTLKWFLRKKREAGGGIEHLAFLQYWGRIFHAERRLILGFETPKTRLNSVYICKLTEFERQP